MTAPKEVRCPLLILPVISCHAFLPTLFWFCLSSLRHLPYVFRRKSIGFPYSCSVPLFLGASYVVSEYGSCYRLALCLESSLLRTFLNCSFLPPFLKEVDIPYFVQNFLLALLAYMESAAAHFTLIFISFYCIRIQFCRGVCPHWMPWTRCIQWMICRLSVCYWPSHRTRQILFPCLLLWGVHNDGQCWPVTDFPAFKQFLFLYKNLSDDGKPLPVILGILEWSSALFMNFILLYEEFFKKPDHTAFEHPCLWSLPFSFLAVAILTIHSNIESTKLI